MIDSYSPHSSSRKWSFCAACMRECGSENWCAYTAMQLIASATVNSWYKCNVLSCLHAISHKLNACMYMYIPQSQRSILGNRVPWHNRMHLHETQPWHYSCKYPGPHIQIPPGYLRVYNNSSMSTNVFKLPIATCIRAGPVWNEIVRPYVDCICVRVFA